MKMNRGKGEEERKKEMKNMNRGNGERVGGGEGRRSKRQENTDEKSRKGRRGEERWGMETGSGNQKFSSLPSCFCPYFPWPLYFLFTPFHFSSFVFCLSCIRSSSGHYPPYFFPSFSFIFLSNAALS